MQNVKCTTYCVDLVCDAFTSVIQLLWNEEKHQKNLQHSLKRKALNPVLSSSDYALQHYTSVPKDGWNNALHHTRRVL